MKRFVKNIALFILPAILLVAVLMVIPLNKKFACHFIKGNCYNHGEWLYQRIFENRTPVDVAFIGSSRTLHAVDDNLLKKALVERTGIDLNIVNFGFCQQGRNFQYSVLKDLLKHKQPRLVVIEITEDEQRSTHQSFAYIADAVDIITSPFLNAYYLPDFFKAVVVRWEQLKFDLLFKTSIGSQNFSNFGYASMKRVVTNDEIKSNRDYWNRRILRDHKGMAGCFQDRYPLYFLEKSVELLRDKNIEFCFLFIPTSNIDIENSVFDSYYQKRANCYYVRPSNYNKRELWLDASHFNDEGSAEVSEELVEFLTEELCLEKVTPASLLDGNSGSQSEQ